MNEVFKALAGADHPIGRTLTGWLSGDATDVSVDETSPAMLSVAADNLEGFRYDETVKGYDYSNGVFADILFPLGNEIGEPLIFFLALGNQPGVSAQRLDEPPAWIISLGQPYSFGEVVGAIAAILKSKGIRRGADWFADTLRDSGLDPADPSFSSILDRP